MKKFLIVTLIFAMNLFAQTEQQSIELPDFVITGKQSIDVQSAQKPKAELISITSKDFFTPQYSPEELPIFFQSLPIQNLPNIKLSQDYFSGKLNIMLGKYSFPLGELFLTKSFDNYLFNMKVWGSNIKEYIPFAGYNNSGVNISNDFFISTKSDFLPGSKIKLDGAFQRDSYNFFGSLNPNEKRETKNFLANFSLKNNYVDYFHFGFDLEGDVFNVSSNNLKEIKINTNVFTELSFPKFSIGGKVNYLKQNLTDNILQDRLYNFFDSKVYVKTNPLNFINIEAGINYNTNSKNNFFAPFAFGELKIDNNLSISALFNPHIEMMLIKDFQKRNLYSNLNLDNAFVKHTNDLKLGIKYEIKKIFLASITSNIASYDNYIFYLENSNNKKYDIFTKNDVSKFSLVTNFYLYNNFYGNLFGEFTYQKIQDSNNKQIPFEPTWNLNLNYCYKFNFNFSVNVGYSFLADYYSDLFNNQRINNYSNLNFGCSYELLNGLKIKMDFQNILNKSNFVWQYYKEKTFDYSAGIEYRW